MKLAELLIDQDIVHIRGDVEQSVFGVAYDSRKVEKGYIFVCIKGFTVDGHDFISQAVENGAVAIVVEKEVEPLTGITIIQVKNGRKSLSGISAHFYGNPSKDMKIIGITGTNGKTTTTHLIKSVLEANGVKTGLIGTMAHKILDKEYKANNTTPESLELHKLFHEMLLHHVDTCVMEVSSHSLELDRVANIPYEIGVFTNLTPDHMDFHQNIENYRKAKAKLFYQTKRANIINIDDPHGQQIAEEIKNLEVRCLTYGIKEKTDIYAKNIEFSSKGTCFTLVTPSFEGDIKISTPGMFSVYNALAAVAVCYVFGYSFDEIKKGLESISGVPGRLEIVPNTGQYTVIVDYAHTPDALENVLKTIRGFTEGRIITVFGCGGDRDKTKRPMMGKIAGDLSDFCILTSDNPRSEQPESILNDIEVGIKDTLCKYKMIVDRKEAIKEALKLCHSTDVVLIAGKGHETYQILGKRTIDFDDRTVAQEILREERI